MTSRPHPRARQGTGRSGEAVIASHSKESRRRDDTLPWRAWYKTSRWQKLRWSILVRDLFTCQMCHRIEADTSKLHCDHVDPKSKATDFWAGPFQTLCAHCHNSIKQSEEKTGRKAVTIGLDGWPTA